MSVRRQLQDALRTQDILDLERAIANAKAFITAANADDSIQSEAAQQVQLKKAGFYSATDLNALVLDAKKMYLEVYRNCKHLVKPLRRATEARDGPGIVESLDHVYRTPSTVQRNFARDVRLAEGTLHLLMRAAMDAPKVQATEQWGEVDRYLTQYASVLNEDVVMELTNLRDGLLQLSSPKSDHVSPLSSGGADLEDEVEASHAAHYSSSYDRNVTRRLEESPDHNRVRPPKAAASRIGNLHAETSSSSSRPVIATDTSRASAAGSRLPTDILELHHRLREEHERSRYYGQTEAAHASAIFFQRPARHGSNPLQLQEEILRQGLLDVHRSCATEEDAERAELYRNFFREWGCTSGGHQAIEARIRLCFGGSINGVAPSQPQALFSSVSEWKIASPGTSPATDVVVAPAAVAIDDLSTEARLSTEKGASAPCHGGDEQSATRFAYERFAPPKPSRTIHVKPSSPPSSFRYTFEAHEIESEALNHSSHQTSELMATSQVAAVDASAISHAAPGDSPQQHQTDIQRRNIAAASTSVSVQRSTTGRLAEYRATSDERERHSISMHGVNSCDPSAANSVEASRNSSPAPLHPLGQLAAFNERPPMVAGGGGFRPSTTASLLQRAALNDVIAEENNARRFIEQSEMFAVSTELAPRHSRLLLAQRLAQNNLKRRQEQRSAYSVPTEGPSDSVSLRNGATHSSYLLGTPPPDLTANDAGRDESSVSLGRWGMHQDPFITPQSHASTLALLKSPSPPSASDDDDDGR